MQVLNQMYSSGGGGPGGQAGYPGAGAGQYYDTPTHPGSEGQGAGHGGGGGADQKCVTDYLAAVNRHNHKQHYIQVAA